MKKRPAFGRLVLFFGLVGLLGVRLDRWEVVRR
jgi:hypothetical protein